MTRIVARATLVAICVMSISLTVAVAQSPLVGMPYMTDRPGGPEMKSFPTGVDTVYLVFDYNVGRETEIIVEIREEQSEGAVIFTDRRTYSGSGTATIEVKYLDGEPFQEGVYDTIIKFGPQRYITAGWEWGVGHAPPEPIESRVQVQATGQAQAQSALPMQAPGQSVAPAPPPVSVTGGLPSAVLALLGAIVLILVGVIVWAVRGFMTAA